MMFFVALGLVWKKQEFRLSSHYYIQNDLLCACDNHNIINNQYYLMHFEYMY